MKKRYSSGSINLNNMTSDMTKQQKDAVERATDAKIEKHFQSQRELPNGRDFRWNHRSTKEEERNYRNNFDNVFPNSPGAGL